MGIKKAMKKFFLECMCKTELIHGEIWDAESDKNEIAKAARPLLEYLRTHYSDPDAEVQMNKDGILMVALPNVSVSFSDSKLDRRICVNKVWNVDRIVSFKTRDNRHLLGQVGLKTMLDTSQIMQSM